MMIKKEYLVEFISYLFQKKNGVNPSPQVLQSWHAVPENEINFHLKSMTQQWGWTDEQLHIEVQNFLNFKNKQAAAEPTPVLHIPNSSAPTGSSHSGSNMLPPIPVKKRRGCLLWILLPIVAIGGYLGFQYMNYESLQRVYGTTDNIAIRDFEGKNVGRMDIFPNKNAVTSLRAMNNTIYNIVVDSAGNISESRKLIADDASFWDFLMEKEEKIMYINKNYLTDNKEYYEIQQVVFSEINKSQFELNQLKSNIRKVIIGSLSKNATLQQLYIKNSCPNNTADYTSILKHTLKDKKTIVVICKMSNNEYYKLKGNPDDNTYEMPVKVDFAIPTDDTNVFAAKNNYLFKKTNDNYFIYDCNKKNLNIISKFDENGDISEFYWEQAPQLSVTPDSTNQIQ